MQLFNAFDAQLRGDIRVRDRHTDLQIGVDIPVLPVDAELGSTGYYTFLQTGELQASYVTDTPQWWACLSGAIELSWTGGSFVLQKGSVFAPVPGTCYSLIVHHDTTLIRAELQDIDGPLSTRTITYFDAMTSGHLVDWTGGFNLGNSSRFLSRQDGLGSTATFTSVRKSDDPGWAAKLNYRHIEWCACFQGVLRVAWTERESGQTQVAFVQPGMVYAPGVGEDHEISAYQSVVGLVCCFKPSLEDLAVTHRLNGETASSY